MSDEPSARNFSTPTSLHCPNCGADQLMPIASTAMAMEPYQSSVEVVLVCIRCRHRSVLTIRGDRAHASSLHLVHTDEGVLP